MPPMPRRPGLTRDPSPDARPGRSLAQEEWDRFMRFMERYAESNDLGFSKA